MTYAFQGASGGTGLLKEVDYDNAGATGAFYTNRFYFDGEVTITKIQIFHDVSNSSGNTEFSVQYRDPDNTSTDIMSDGVVQYTSQSVSKTEKTINLKTDIFQLGIIGSFDDIGFKLIRIFYEPAR